MSSLLRNDQGGITYAREVMVTHEQRTEILAEVRMTVDGLTELCKTVRETWPSHLPMPQELNALLCFQDFILARVRNGSLRRFAQACDQ